MDKEPPVSSHDDGDHVFEWLAHDPVPPPPNEPEAADRSEPGSTPGSLRVPVAPTHARLDPLTVQGVINRVLVLVFCLIAVGATYEAFAAVSSSRVPRSTAVIPTLITTTTATPKPAPTVAPKPTTPAPTTTTPPATVATTTVPATTPPTVPHTTPHTTPPATFPQQVVPLTSPQTTPQTIKVPATTPTTVPTGPSDTVVVPFK